MLSRSAALLAARSSAAVRSTAAARAYHEKVIDHYENPRNVGSLDKSDANVGTGIVGAPACGDVMKLQIKVDEKGTIVDAKFKTFGCGSAIASSSLATEWIKGKNIDFASKLHCSMLAHDAIQAALKDYHAKKEGKPPAGAE
ncbi:Iron-sulfur cluster assembly enzyme ISCU, mitochondrial [Aphelenchoides fujianensis]|nr:Iron-sulfur cluster assembly enzyme ISCU, mitochondrial [Aphelenchoides fujianensis]